MQSVAEFPLGEAETCSRNSAGVGVGVPDIGILATSPPPYQLMDQSVMANSRLFSSFNQEMGQCGSPLGHGRNCAPQARCRQAGREMRQYQPLET